MQEKLKRRPRNKVYKNPRKSFHIQMDEDVYNEISERSLVRNITMTAYILQPVIERIKREKKYE